jgi:hypothetical protein
MKKILNAKLTTDNQSSLTPLILESDPIDFEPIDFIKSK